MKNFWQKLNKPFFVLAPMADVTDFAQRQILAKYGKPDVTYTEFVSADGLASEKGREVLIKELRFEENERPIVVQIFGAKPENIEIAAKLIAKLGFDGVDINMGCPDKNVIKQGAGSALIKNPQLAREIIKAAKKGAGKIPVSVKTRIGFNKNEIETWLPELLAEKPAAIIIHGRTKKELSEVDAHWDVIKRANEIARDSGVLIIGNGDVKNIEDGRQRAQESGVDGIMIGRGIFGNPWIFNQKKDIKKISLEKRFAIMLEHTKLFEKELMRKNIHPHTYSGGEKNNQKDKASNKNNSKVKNKQEISVGVKGFHVMKKHFKAYVSGFDGAKELRAKLMECENSGEAEEIMNEYLENLETNH